ncbi:MAG: DNA repair protein RadA, partial [Clostridia bacterium]|nr:DNA repair protein RadA [Clostridia bacterium]
LAGECRAVSNLEQRIKEAARLGFKHAIVPYRNLEKRKIEADGINVIPIRGIYEVLNMMKAQE